MNKEIVNPCKDCGLSDICKFTEDVKKAEDMLKSVIGNPCFSGVDNPLRINLQCFRVSKLFDIPVQKPAYREGE